MAGNNIKGITIDIGGNTAPLNKALADVNKTSRNLQIELKQVDKLLKLDPTNTEALSQKQKILASSINETKTKLDTLKEAEKQVQKQFQNGEISEEQYRALKREIIKTEQELSEFGKAAKLTADAIEELGKGTKYSAEEIEKAKKEVAEYGEKLKSAGETAKSAAADVGMTGAAIVAAGTYAVKFNSDYDKAFNGFIAKTGIAGDAAGDFDEVLSNIYKNNYGEDINDVAAAMATVAQNARTIDPTNIEELTTSALTLRDTFDFEVSETMRAANMLVDQFGITGKEAFNLIAQGAQNGLDKNGDLLDSINEYSVHFKQLGLNAEEMFNSLANGAYSGTFSVDKLGDAIKEFGIRAKDNSDSTKGAFTSLGLNADELTKKFTVGGATGKQAFQEVTTALFAMEDKVKQNEIGVALFGTMWEDLGVEGVAAIADINGEFDKTYNALDEIGNIKYNDLESAMSGLKRTIEIDVAKPIGESLTPTVNEIINTVKKNAPSIKNTVQSISKQVLNLCNWLLNNGNTIIGIITSIAAGFLAFKATSIITGAVNAFKSLQIAMTGAKTAQELLNIAMKKNVIGIIVAAIAALVAGFIYLWNNCEGFRNFFIGMWDGIKAAFQSFINWIAPAVEGIKTAFQAFLDWISPAIEAIKGYFEGLWTKLQEIWAYIIQSVQPIKDAISGAFSEAWELIKVVWDLVQPYFATIWENIKVVFSVVKEVLSGFFEAAWIAIQAVWDVVSSYFAAVWDTIKAIFSVVATYLGGMFSTAWTAIKAVWDTVTGYFTAVWNTIKGIFAVVKAVLSGNWSDAWEAIKGIVNTWANFFSGVWNSIKAVFSSVSSWFSDTFSAAWTAVKNVFSTWGSFFAGLWDTIKNTFSSLGTSIANAIGGAVKAGINGVISMIQNTINDAIGIINGAINLINKIPGVTVGKVARVTLPHLAAKGAVLTKATPIIAGEDGAEAIMPLEKHTAWIDVLANKLTKAMYNGQMPQPKAAPAVSTNLGGLNFTIEKFENHTDKDLRELMGEAMEVAEEYIKRRGGAFA